MPEFAPLNERLKKQYEDILLNGRHHAVRTVDGVWKAINLFETFTGRQPFTKFNAEQAKGFRHWLAKQTTPKGAPLSIASMRSTLANVREFFLWLALHPKMKKRINPQMVEYLHLSNNDNRAARASKPRQVPTVTQIRQAVEAMPCTTDIEHRDRALMALVAITGVRDGALVGLRLKDVDVGQKVMWQDPKHVKTKFGKGIYTAFVPVDAWLEEVVLAWVAYARQVLKLEDDDPLFPATLVRQNPDTLSFEVVGVGRAPWKNAQAVRQIFKTAFMRAGLPYFHPHTCRHMLINWGMEHTNQIEFKALSQNLGHENAMTSYNSYGYIQPDKQVKLLRGLGQRSASLVGVSKAELLAELVRQEG